jgi:hypothetical protein
VSRERAGARESKAESGEERETGAAKTKKGKKRRGGKEEKKTQGRRKEGGGAQSKAYNNTTLNQFITASMIRVTSSTAIDSIKKELQF